MRKLALVSALSFLSALALAGAAQANESIQAANNQATFAVGSHDLEYHEIDTYGLTNGGYLDSETGHQPAFKFGLTRQGGLFGLSDIYLGASLAYAKGDTHYDGYLQGGPSLVPYAATTRSTTTDFSLRLGRAYSFASVPDLQLTPFVGYGHQTWVRDMQGDYGYKETYSHHLVEAGLMAQYAFTPALVGSVDASYGRTLGAEMETDGYSTFKLGSKPRTSVGVGIDYAITRQWHANASYRLTQFKYGESQDVGGAVEPNSKSTTQEAMAGVGFHF